MQRILIADNRFHRLQSLTCEKGRLHLSAYAITSKAKNKKKKRAHTIPGMVITLKLSHCVILDKRIADVQLNLTLQFKYNKKKTFLWNVLKKW